MHFTYDFLTFTLWSHQKLNLQELDLNVEPIKE